jgi:LPXTG-site transpeptidase (sortase) family protein
MLLNPHHSGYAVLLVGLFLVTSGVSCASPTSSTPDSTQPAQLTSPTISTSTVEFATKTLEVLDPAPISMVPSATSTPEALNPAPNEAGTGLDIEDHRPVKKSFDTSLPEQDRTPTRLVIPTIELDAPVELVGWHVEIQASGPANVWDAPDHFAVGWLKSSAPLGIPGNTVLDGHHNIKGKVFENLINIQVGDTIELYTASMEHVYRVDQKLILKEAGQPLEVRQANERYIDPTADERLTLVTCWPPTGNTHRLIIIARPVSSSPYLLPSPSVSGSVLLPTISMSDENWH